MSERRIGRITVKRIGASGEICVRAEAEIVNPPRGNVQIITSDGVRGINPDPDTDLNEIADAQLAELRRRLYAAGFSKRAIAMAVKNVTHENG